MIIQRFPSTVCDSHIGRSLGNHHVIEALHSFKFSRRRYQEVHPAFRHYLLSSKTDLTGARPQVGLSSLPQRSRKRQRNDSPRAMHNAGVDPDRPLWKFLQALHIRIKNLEEVVEECIRKTHIASESPQKTASILDSCVARLEQKLSLVYNYNESPTGSEREYCYPADSCNRSYSRMDLFHGHIRGSPGLGHKSLKSIIDETRCLQCNFPYRSPHELVSHEMIDHKDGYMSRIQAFVQHFRSTSSKQNPMIDIYMGHLLIYERVIESTCETSSNVGDEGHLAQNNDGHQPLSSNVRLIDEQPSLTSSLVNPPQAISIGIRSPSKDTVTFSHLKNSNGSGTSVRGAHCRCRYIGNCK